MIRRRKKQNPRILLNKEQDKCMHCVHLSLRDKTFASRTGIHALFQASSRGSTHFLPTAAKSKQKRPLSGKTLTPFIDQIKQAAFSRSRRRKAQLAISITAPSALASCFALPPIPKIIGIAVRRQRNSAP
jgi:hypothetical protein